MKMEELLSAASDEMDHKLTKENETENDSHETSSSQATSNASEPAGTSSSSKAKNTTPPPSSSSSAPSTSARNTIRTRSKKESPPPLTIDPPDHDDNDTQTVPSTSPSSSTPSSISPSASSPATSPIGGAAGGEPKKLCKTVGCIVCSKGPPSSFTKGTPIWAQILHLVLFALTESAKVNVMGSPKMKVKRYFHLRDDIYEYISIHWDVICRRERIKNWRHTIGMTLSHYQNLFQNGYHIYQNTGYWSMKDNVPSPYVIDPLIGEGASPGKKRKYKPSSSSSSSQDKDIKDKEKEKDKDSSAALTPFISDFPISPPLNSSGNHKNNDEEKNKMRRLDLDQTHNNNNNNNNNNYSGMTRESGELRKALHNSLLHPPQPRIPMHVVSDKGQQGARFDEMKGAIDKFKREMVDIQAEIHSLQEQLQVKKAEEHLLKFLQDGISSFRDKIKTRIDLLKTEMAHNQNEHQFQMHNMASELVEKNYIHSHNHNNYNNHNHNNNHNSHNNNHHNSNSNNNNHGHSLMYVPPSLKYLHQYARHNNWPDWSCN